MNYSFIVKDGKLTMDGTYNDGILTGHDYLVSRILDEVSYMDKANMAIPPYHYGPEGKYLDNPLAVKLIIEHVFGYENVKFVGDVPEIEPDNGEIE